MRLLACLLFLGALAVGLPAGGLAEASAESGGWRRAAPLPVPRTEVAAAVVGKEIVIVGGFLRDGSSSRRVHAYSPRRNRWRRLPNLPIGVHHAMAASWKGRLYVVGGYNSPGVPLRTAWVFEQGAWRALRSMPESRAAAGAAIVQGKLVVAGGVGPVGLAEEAFALDLRTRRWSRMPGPTPREHLAVAALAGRIYAVGGRKRGIDTNVALVEVLATSGQRWRRLPPVPGARGGTGLAAVGTSLVSVGGEEPVGTIASVYAYHVKKGRWRRLPDLKKPRHGLGVAALGSKVYAIAGGKKPGLFVSSRNEVLRVR